MLVDTVRYFLYIVQRLLGCDSSLVGKVEIPFILCMNKTYMNNRVLF